MSKDEAVAELNKRNYIAENESGVVMVYSDTLSFSELQALLKEIGYNASYGLMSEKRRGKNSL